MESRKAFLLRIDPGLWKELEAWAADELRSVNGQIEYLLRDAVARRRRAAPEPAEPPAEPGAPADVSSSAPPLRSRRTGASPEPTPPAPEPPAHSGLTPLEPNWD